MIRLLRNVLLCLLLLLPLLWLFADYLGWQPSPENRCQSPAKATPNRYNLARPSRS